MKQVIAFVLMLFFLWQPVQALEIKGRLEWLHKTDMRVLVDGVVDKVNVILGQRVKKGDVLLQLDQREFKADIDEADARLSQAILATESAERENQRTQELFDRGLISIEDQKAVELLLATKKAQQIAANTTLIKAKIALERSQLNAPFNGIVISQNAWKGDVIYKTMQSEPLLAIAPNNKMLARVLVPANKLHQYKKGQKARVLIRGKSYKGAIYQLGVEAVRIEPEGAIYELDVVFNSPSSSGLRPTESVQVNLP